MQKKTENNISKNHAKNVGGVLFGSYAFLVLIFLTFLRAQYRSTGFYYVQRHA